VARLTKLQQTKEEETSPGTVYDPMKEDLPEPLTPEQSVENINNDLHVQKYDELSKNYINILSLN